MSILIKNAYHVYTFDESLREFENGYIYVEGNIISNIGSGTPDHLQADEVIDASGKVVLPGLINVHHHFFQQLTRNVPAVQKCSSLNWINYLYKIWSGIDEEVVYYASLVAIGELLLTGCTTTCDFLFLFPGKHRKLLDYEFQAATELGIRFHGFRGCASILRETIPQEKPECLSALPEQFIESEDEILLSCEGMFNRYHDSREYAMSRVGVGPTRIIYNRPSFMRELKELAAIHRGLCQTHIHPRPDEEERCKELHHCTTLEFLENIGWLDGFTSIVHTTRHTSKDIMVLARNKAAVVHCPSSNMRLGYPVAPILEMISKGVVAGIGVDGGSSNDTSDMLGELRTTMLVHRIKGLYKNFRIEDSLCPRDVFCMAIKNGARILNRNDIGSLEVNKAADIILIDITKIPYAGGLHDPLGALIYCGCNHIVDTSIINGKFVVKNSKLTQASEESIALKANEIATQLVARTTN